LVAFFELLVSTQFVLLFLDIYFGQ
jgi:hypothetical protein